MRVPEKVAADTALTDAQVLERAAELKSEFTMEMMQHGYNKYLEVTEVKAKGATVEAGDEAWAQIWLNFREHTVAQMQDV